MIVKNEFDRYLTLVIGHLLEFCDEVCVLDDHSDDGGYEWMLKQERVNVHRNPGDSFYKHEGHARQALLEWTLDAEPTHVLAIDADEFVSDGSLLKAVLTHGSPGLAWSLSMEEIWKADARHLQVRQDGGWRAHPVPVLYAVPRARDSTWRIAERQLACGREPLAVRAHAGRARPTQVSVLHFGWTRLRERQKRYDRYVAHDGGKFHASSHLQSIMWPDERVRLTTRDWPPALPKDKILDAAQ
jgi:glycosyltransferase involved in cell wall biosynthesis